jgi:hypothetical protein
MGSGDATIRSEPWGPIKITFRKFTMTSQLIKITGSIKQKKK